MRFPRFGIRKAKPQPAPAEPQAKAAPPPGATQDTAPDRTPKATIPPVPAMVSAPPEAPAITALADVPEVAAAPEDTLTPEADTVTTLAEAPAGTAPTLGAQAEARPEAAEVAANTDGAEVAARPEAAEAEARPEAIEAAANADGVEVATYSADADARLVTQPDVPSEAEAPESDPLVDEAELLRSARAAREAGRLDEARTLLRMAAERFPEFAPPRHDLARMAEADHDWPEAERWWREFGLLHPTIWWVITQTAHVVRLQGRPEEAEALLAAALERLPTEVQLFVHYARIARNTPRLA